MKSDKTRPTDASDNYLVFSLKYRPQTFDELRCQDPVKETLKQAIRHNRVAHSYLFCGPRGVGKTTTARILAKALNCEKGPTISPDGTCSACREIAVSRSMDVIEIDGASNRQIDDIRDLRESIKYSPSSGRYKIYIIDEIHMLTDFAFNALLKTLEEPPRHAKFIFATTAPHKLPSTILSRCQRFDFRKATVDELVSLLRYIAEREGIKVDEAALFAIARRADGSIRDSETILDQMSAFRPEGIQLQDVQQLLGMVPTEVYSGFVELLKANAPARLVSFVNEVFDRGYNVMEFFSGLTDYVRSLLVLRLGVDAATLGLAPGDVKRMTGEAARFEARELQQMLEILVSFEEAMKFSLMPRVLLEVMALKLAAPFAPTAHPPPAASIEPQSHKGRQSTSKTSAPAHQPTGAPFPSGERLTLGAVWDQLLTQLQSSKPLLAGVLSEVQVIEPGTSDQGPEVGGQGSGGRGQGVGAIRITRPPAPMWDDKELAAELAALEPLLAQIAGHPLKIVVEQGTAPGKAKPSKAKSAIDKLKAVYDCEEV